MNLEIVFTCRFYVHSAHIRGILSVVSEDTMQIAEHLRLQYLLFPNKIQGIT